MAEVIRMPKMSDTMEEGVIASWLVKVGDEVSSGDVLAEVETDKATMELESYEDGVILHIGVEEKSAVAIDGIIAVIGEEGEAYEHLLKEAEGSSNGASESSEAKDEASSDDEGNDAEGSDIDVSDIAASAIRMPKMSDTMEEGVIASWLVKEGDEVSSGDVLAEVETDKATMELESYEDGTLLHIGVEAGSSVPIDGIIAIIGEKDADYKALLQAEKSNASKKSSSEPKKEEKSASDAASTAAQQNGDSQESTSQSTQATTTDGGRIKASPLAKKMAEEKGYDLSLIEGTGENGRIVKRDIESYEPSAQPAVASKEAAPVAKQEQSQQSDFVMRTVNPGEEKYTEESVSQMRKTIAKRLAESKFTAPHFYLTMEIDMDKAVAARKSMNELSPVKISFNDIVIKAAAAALRQHPAVNSSWLGDKIRYNHHIHIGVAVAVDEGLLVPVVRFADQKPISQISAEVKELGGKAKDKKLQPTDWEGNTFTISNLGMFGIEEFTAIINPPDACIMAVGGIKQTPVVRDGEIKVGNVMKVTLSCDHRVVDGAVGSAFLKTFKQFLEDPVRILI